MFYTRAWCVIFEDRKMEGTIKVPLAISTPKQTVMKGLDEPTLEAAIRGQAQYPAFSHWVNSEDRIEGAAAFAEKRAPNWQGK
jgi:crotonobetainyl-CoA hydratase|tara:strand:- start:382 stop:630 length:249 start_codon:yes stop_codon:yes gene_type:complete